MGKIKALLKEIINLLGVYDQALLLQHQVKRFILGYYGDKNIDIKDINIFHIKTRPFTQTINLFMYYFYFLQFYYGLLLWERIH